MLRARTAGRRLSAVPYIEIFGLRVALWRGGDTLMHTIRLGRYRPLVTRWVTNRGRIFGCLLYQKGQIAHLVLHGNNCIFWQY